jgi:hypothetical protein
MIFKLIMRGELRYYSCLLGFRDAVLVVGVIEFFVRFSAMHGRLWVGRRLCCEVVYIRM